MSIQKEEPNIIRQAEKLHQSGKLARAETIYRRVLRDNPNHSEALRLLGLLAHQTGNSQQGQNLILQAINSQPENIEAHFNLGIIQLDLNLAEKAIETFRSALLVSPMNYSCLVNLGNALGMAGHFSEAINKSKLALEIDPNNVEALSNLGYALSKSGKLTDAMSVLRRTILLRPNDSHLYNNLGIVEQEIGLIETANQTYEEALRIDPQCKKAERNLMLNTLNLPDQESERLFSIRRRYGKRYDRDNLVKDKFSNRNKDRNRKLRIGYLSSDFHAHPVGFNLLPLIINHDKETMEIFIYNLDEKLDNIRKKFKGRSKGQNFIKSGVWVLVGLRSWESAKAEGKHENCDLLEVYYPEDVKWLKKNDDQPWFIIESVGRVETYGDGDADDAEFSGDEFGVLASDEDEYLNEYIGGGSSSKQKSTPGQYVELDISDDDEDDEEPDIDDL